MPLTLKGATSGGISLKAADVAGSNTITFPAATGTVLTSAGSQTVNTSIGINGATSGTITLAVPAVAGTNTITLAAQTGTLNAAGPSFHASASGSQTVTTTTLTKVLFTTEDWDTNNNFASSTFTPTVAGYYQINAIIRCTVGTTASNSVVQIYKNGASWSINTAIAPSATLNSVALTDVVYCNGSTDYIEIYANQTGTGTLTLTSGCTFSGCLLRGA